MTHDLHELTSPACGPVVHALVAEVLTDPQWPEHGWVAFRVTPEMTEFPRLVELPDGEVMHLAGYVSYPGEPDEVTYELLPGEEEVTT